MCARATAVPDAVRVPGDLGHGDRTGEDAGRGARRRATAAEAGRTTSDRYIRPRHRAADEHSSVWRAGHLGARSLALYRS